MSNTPSNLSTLASVIKHGIESRLKDLHTAMPGIIISFDSVNQLASVQPAIKRVFKAIDGEKEILTPTDLPLLINVPVQFPRGGGFSMTFPISPGDECLLTFVERSIDKWHKFGGVQEAGAKRFHALSDATALVGLSSEPNKIPNFDPLNTEIKKDDGSVSIKWNSNGSMDIFAISDVNINTGGDARITATTNIEFNAPNVAITSTNLTHNGINIGSTHYHSQGNDSNGDAEVDTDGPQ